MASLEQEIKKSPSANENLEANLNILFTANFLNSNISSLLKRFKLTHEQFNVLIILCGRHPKGLRQKDILSRMIARKYSVTLIIQKNWVVVVDKSEWDKGIYIIKIRDSGLHFLKESAKEYNGREEDYDKQPISETLPLNTLDTENLKGY